MNNKDNSQNKPIIILIAVNLLLAGIIFVLARQLAIKPPEIFVQIPYSPANIAVDASIDQGPFHPFWLGFAQGGEEAKNSMLTPTVEKMRELNPSYIRLDHIFDDDYYGVVSGSSGNLQFNWSNLDKAVEDILAMGAKPFFSLGYMPGAMAGSKIDVPYNWDDWYSLVRAMVQHYSGKNGKNIPGVYYEVWNEPDLEIFGSWKRGGDKNYLTLYEYAAKGAMAAENSNQFFIGGPATTGLYRNWVLDLYNFCGSKGLRLDFISWHRYSFNPYQFSRDIADIHQWLAGRPIPRLVISEWGPTPEKSNTYSTSYAAAHAFAVVRQLLDSVNLITVFEIKDGPGQEGSGWGLLGHETAGMGVKPRFLAFSWLSQVKGNRVLLGGEGSNVQGWAVRENNKIAVYLVNFGEGSQTENVPVLFKGLADGTVMVTKEVLFGGKSSQELPVINGSLQTLIELRPNGIGRVILTRI